MASSQRVNPDVWGYLESDGTVHDLSGTSSTSYASQDGEYPAGVAYRAYWSFNTSVIPDMATLTAVSLRVRIKRVDGPVGFSGLYLLRFNRQNDRIGASLDFSDWSLTGGTWALKFFPSNPGTDVDFDLAGGLPSLVNKLGDTDIEVLDIGGYADPPGPLFYHFTTKDGGGTFRTWLTANYILQGALSKTPSGNISHFGPMCLMALSRLLMQAGIIPLGSRVDRIEGADIHVVTRFTPRTVMGACS